MVDYLHQGVLLVRNSCIENTHQPINTAAKEVGGD